MGVSIFTKSPGHYILQGYLSTEVAARELHDYVISSFPYPDKLLENVYIEELLLREVIAMLFQEKLLALKPSILLGHVTIKGVYSKRKEEKLEKVVREIKKLNGVAHSEDSLRSQRRYR